MESHLKKFWGYSLTLQSDAGTHSILPLPPVFLWTNVFIYQKYEKRLDKALLTIVKSTHPWMQNS